MKFCKIYEDYMQRRAKDLPALELKKLKKVLRRCRREFQSDRDAGDFIAFPSRCPDHCPVCDGSFFPSLLREVSAVVGCFNKQVQKLLKLHLASGFQKYLILLKSRHRLNHLNLMKEGRDLVYYGAMNAIAMRKILKKYDKIHCSKQGQTFKSYMQSIHLEILQSPWLCELMAFHINLKERSEELENAGLFANCLFRFIGEKPFLSCGLIDSVKIDIDLTCSVCLETLFDPVALACGHIFCFMCACSAASVSVVDGLTSTDTKSKCPLCRQAGVYEGAVHLEELNLLISRSCEEYWSQRSQFERVERVKQVKEHWQSQCRTFSGI